MSSALQPGTSLPLGILVEHPDNPRQTFGATALKDLTASIREIGVLSPILVRKVGRKYQILAGHRRVRAAKAAGLKTVPAVVRKLDDESALQAMVLDNLQREDLPALEEAAGFQLLLEKHKLSAEAIGAKVGKSKAYVYARLKLLALPVVARKALGKGELSASVALLLARLPAKVAKEALPHMYEEQFTNGRQVTVPASFRSAQLTLRSRFARRLKDATWGLEDETLPGGSCAECEHRSASAPELFDALVPDAADVCTNLPCWAEKDEAWAGRRLAEAKAGGATVLSETARKKAFPWNSQLAYNADLIDLDAACYDADSGTGKCPIWRNAIGGKIPPADLVVTVDDAGKVRELMRPKVARALAKERGKAWAKATIRHGVTTSPQQVAADKKRNREAKIRSAASRSAIEDLVSRVDVGCRANDWPVEIWRLVVTAVWREIWNDSQKEVAKRRGWAKTNNREICHDGLEDVAGYQALLVEMLAVRNAAHPYDSGYGETLTAMSKAFGVSLKRHETAARKKLAPKPKKKAPAKKKAVAKRKAPAKKKAPRKAVKS